MNLQKLIDKPRVRKLFLTLTIFAIAVTLLILYMIQKQSITITPPSKITVSGVQMNDFLSSPLEKNENGDVLFAKTSQYQLVYLPNFEQFIITVLATPFDSNRKVAEEAFLTTLGIAQTQACKLRVSLGTTKFVDPENAGINYNLSFCSSENNNL